MWLDTNLTLHRGVPIAREFSAPWSLLGKELESALSRCHAACSAIKSQRMFNLMHLDSAIKVDLIVRKNSEYRHAEFERPKSVDFAGISTWIASREDLILSKLVWACDTGSEMELTK